MASLEVPCGQCIGCRLERTRDWAVRMMHESSLHSDNSFVTLTYDDDKLPFRGQLRYRDVQLFLKRLRKQGGFRFFCTGEYGEVFSRPHYHLALFGYWPTDAEKFSMDSDYWDSKALESVWGHGRVS